MQSIHMQTNWAEKNLQTIRTLMERSAVYRRALAPIMLFAGMLGILAAAIGLIFHLDSISSFCALWLSTAAVVVVVAFLNTRLQAIRDKEALWSPPTRRVAQAALPPLFSGMFFSSAFLFVGINNLIILVLMWLFFYGCALHAAGFFMQRSTKAFGWIFIGMACAAIVILICLPTSNGATTMEFDRQCPYWLMGFFFGALHLVYGTYLYLTEKGKNAA
jgi:hypothetical protein